MSNITDELNKIINAVYGRDVRQAIHDGIEKAYNDATSGGAGDTNLEVVLARGSYDALNKRLNAADARLAEKANQTYVDDELENTLNQTKNYLDGQLEQIGNMTPKGAYPTLQDLQNAYPNGTEGVFLVQADGHWYYWNGSNWDDGGEYQAQPWDEFMTEQDEEWVI